MTGLRELPRFVQVGLCLLSRCSGRPSALALQKHHALACWLVPSLDRDETSFSIINMTWGKIPHAEDFRIKKSAFELCPYTNLSLQSGKHISFAGRFALPSLLNIGYL